MVCGTSMESHVNFQLGFCVVDNGKSIVRIFWSCWVFFIKIIWSSFIVVDASTTTHTSPLLSLLLSISHSSNAKNVISSNVCSLNSRCLCCVHGSKKKSILRLSTEHKMREKTEKSYIINLWISQHLAERWSWEKRVVKKISSSDSNSRRHQRERVSPGMCLNMCSQ